MANSLSTMSDKWFETLLGYHLQNNQYPSVSLDFIPICIEAIECYNMGEFDVEITMPNGIVKTAWDIVDGLHLDWFIDNENQIGD